jgi:hypothetical protein
MAATVAGDALTDQHRRAQLVLRALTLRQVLAVWPGFRLDDIAGTWPATEAALLAIIAQRREDSARIAAGYYQAFRTAEGVPGSVPLVLDTFDDSRLAAAMVSLRVTGPATVSRLSGLRAERPMDTAFVRVSGAVARHVLDGGRQTLLDTMRSDRRRPRWRRITSAEPCAFCTMLAGRGAVYQKDTAGFQSHDHCACTAEPAF